LHDLKLIQRKECWTLTIRAKLILLGVFIPLLFFLFVNIHPFLSLQKPIQTDGNVLVAEGWLPEYALRKALQEFSTGSYRWLVTTGGPISSNSFISNALPYRNFADLAEANLLYLGCNSETLRAVPAPPVEKDRTFASAIALREWIDREFPAAKGINLVTLGAHARRSRMMFQRAFDGRLHVGVIAIENRDYDPGRWWRTSSGVRTLLGEAIAYLYAFFFFSPDEPPSTN